MKKGVDFVGVTVVYFCHDGEGNYFLSKRNKNARDEHGCWCPGGGGLEFGDSAEETLKREITEEYCTDVLGYEFLGFRDVLREQDGVKTHWVALDFRVHINREKAKNGEPHKFDEVKWFKIDAFPTPLHSQFPFCLDKYKDKLV